MTKQQQQVKEFMVKAGQYCPIEPTIPEAKIRKLRIQLIAEELCELAEALGVYLTIKQYSKQGVYIVTAEVMNDVIPSLKDAADATADLRVVTVGTDIAMGIDGEPIDEEVHRSNMTKFIDGYPDSDGKWCKGPSYSPANIAPLIEAQMKREK